MEIVNKKKDINLLILNDFNSKLDLDWESNFNEYQTEITKKVINPLENYEMSIYNYRQYLLDSKYLINDLHINFLFYNSTYQNNYTSIGFLNQDIYSNNDYFKKSFFRLEYYKTENNELPSKLNRRLVATKVINLNDGTIFYDQTIKENIFKPYFISSTILNKSINNFYWFTDDTVVKNSNLDNNIFWISAKFFNAKNGYVYDFINKNKQFLIDDTNDIYFKMTLNSDYTYIIQDMDNYIIGNKQTPITFYQRNG